MGLSGGTARNRTKPHETASTKPHETARNRSTKPHETADCELSNVSNEVHETARNRTKPHETAEHETAEVLIPCSGYRIKQYVGGLIPGLSPTALRPKP
jgi:hypothetical protein